MVIQYIFDRMFFSEQAFDAWVQLNNWHCWRHGQPSYYTCNEIPGLDPPCPARMRMRRLPGGRFEVSLKYDHQHGRVIYFFVHALSEFNLFALI
uniref:Uncharacterized protein n=1 Tax=Meloidogyne enterolobii TaxID=390850 RepID=A0A6V7WU50_MELEN|nr:unnamed protein product [Meloidogyne enterolobii]